MVAFIGPGIIYINPKRRWMKMKIKLDEEKKTKKSNINIKSWRD